jgi:hypothetical protein
MAEISSSTGAFAIDRLFEEANSIIAALPTRPATDSFYDLVDIGTAQQQVAWRRAADRLLELAAAGEEAESFLLWASDALIGLDEIEQALEVRPVPELGTRSSMQTDRRLTLKFALGRAVTGRDVATLFGPKLTAFGRENVVPIAEFLDIQVSQIQQRENRNLLAERAGDAYCPPHGTTLFSGHPSYVLSPALPDYNFSRSPTAETMCVGLMRDAENTFRDERDIPRIGEGWVAETALYYLVKAHFAGEAVLHHGRPDWLGRQHLDVYLPDRRVALEYQGEQHDRPIAFFGGEEAFRRNVERDRIKQAKCQRNGVRLIHVREGYDPAELLARIATP